MWLLSRVSTQTNSKGGDKMKRHKLGKILMREKVRLAAFVLLFLFLVLPNFLFAQAKMAESEGLPNFLFAPPKTYHLEGLEKGATILRDKWGTPHIYGQTEEDLFFAQGFNAARDRLWQLDLWRRQGEGKLAEAFGERFLEKDKAARLFLYRGDLEKEFKSYHPEGKKILTAFVNGINAYIDLTRAHPDLLPLEFKLTCTTPGYWTPTSPLVRIFGLTRNVGRELTLARLVKEMGAEAVENLMVFEPPAELEVPPGLALSLIPSDVLKNYNLARGSITFMSDDICSLTASSDRAHYAQLLSQTSLSQTHDTSQPQFASNNWTISGKLTSTGRPILANDPHRAQSVPSLRYMAHLVGPGWNVIGAGEPALPGISIGHNERIAFGLTIFAFADEEDLYVYDTNPDNPSQYLYKGKWKHMKIVEETFNVKGKNPVTAQLKFTRHGPVIYEDLLNKKAYALRAAYLEHEGTAVYLPSLRVDQAENWHEFVKAMEKHYCPSENMVYADVDGNIGWFGGSIAPIRPNWNGLLPVPGNGDYEWAGFLDTKKLPKVFNPKEGFFATANQYNVPEGYPYTSIGGHEWSDPYRFDRIVEVLSSGKKFTVRDSERLQYDDFSLPAEELVPFLHGLSSSDSDVQAALDSLLLWDFVLSKDSVPATIYELWVQQLKINVRNLYVPVPARSIFGTLNQRVLFRLLSSPDSAFGPDPIAGRNALLIQSLGEAVNRLKTAYFPGLPMDDWKWGALHFMKYVHGLSSAVDPSTQDLLNTDRLGQSGDSYTVHNTGYGSDFNQSSGASFREVMDLRNWEKSVGLNSPGQSGNPKSPHYDDLFPLWIEGQFVPFYFSLNKVLSVTEDILILQPARKHHKH
jgi:penicillin amidase